MASRFRAPRPVLVGCRDKLQEQMAERIGIFGGTFDPVHVGHLVAAVNARHDLGLDRVVLMVANVPWQKVGGRKVTPAEDRFEMVQAAVGGVAGVEASRMEIDRGGPSYTADTISEMAVLYPDAELFVIVGWDVSAELGTWERLNEVRDLASLVVVNRPGTPPPVGLLQQSASSASEGCILGADDLCPRGPPRASRYARPAYREAQAVRQASAHH